MENGTSGRTEQVAKLDRAINSHETHQGMSKFHEGEEIERGQKPLPPGIW